MTLTLTDRPEKEEIPCCPILLLDTNTVDRIHMLP
jgi:hypothetical protein